MGKFVFNEYHIKLHGKEYDILVPSVKIAEMWAFTMREMGKCDNWDVIEGNCLAMQWVRNAYITLYQEPNKIIYFSLRDIPPAYGLQLWTLPPDLVLYNHQIQLKRKNWKKTETLHEIHEAKTACSVFQYAGINENTTAYIQTVGEKQIILLRKKLGTSIP